MSTFTESLAEPDDDDVKKFLLERLSQAEVKVEPFALITSREKYPECAY